MCVETDPRCLTHSMNRFPKARQPLTRPLSERSTLTKSLPRGNEDAHEKSDYILAVNLAFLGCGRLCHAVRGSSCGAQGCPGVPGRLVGVVYVCSVVGRCCCGSQVGDHARRWIGLSLYGFSVHHVGVMFFADGFGASSNIAVSDGALSLQWMVLAFGGLEEFAPWPLR